MAKKQPVPETVTFDPMRDIEEFHEKFGLLYEGRPRALVEGNLDTFRFRFMIEEANEYHKSMVAVRDELNLPPGITKDDGIITEELENMLDALVDLVYVALGTAHLHGFDFKEAWRRVHEANMKKVRAKAASESKRGSAFDVVKPEGWEPPDHSDLVEDHIHRSEEDEDR